MKKLFYLWLISVILVGYVTLFCLIFKQSFSFQMYVIAFVLAPISEELLYRLVPLTLGNTIKKRYNLDLIWVFGIVANFLFIAIHENNYPFGGLYWAFAVQGAMGWTCFLVCKKYGYWYAVILHSKYNVFILFVLPKLLN